MERARMNPVSAAALAFLLFFAFLLFCTVRF